MKSWGTFGVALLAGAGLLLVIAVGLYVLFRSPSSVTLLPSNSDPRRDYAGPFQNVDPAVHYVPEARCADCHADKARSFAEHPMGRSLLPVAQTVAPPEDAQHHNPFDVFGSQFSVARAGGQVRHTRTRLDPDGHPAATLEWEVQYVLGSGGHGHSYLSEREGYLFQTPISWYAMKKVWDLSPGFGQVFLTGRPVQPGCLFCHGNRVNYQEGSVNRYREPVYDGHAIGCQRCHGPGELHVASREKREPVPHEADHSIVNPRHLERSLREAVCEQCHLEGEMRISRRGRGLYDFRPGLPLEQFWSVFLRAADAEKGQNAVGHVEQMYLSRCFQGSGGREGLGCISCHDPHERVRPAQRVAYYRGRCLQCHAQRGCSLPLPDRLRRTAEDSCIDCHMPRYGTADIPHTASTEHRILRVGAAQEATERGPRTTDRGHLPVVSFYRDRKGTEEREDERDLAVALVKLTSGKDAPSAGSLRRSLPMLEAAVERDPNDLPAGEALGYALALQGRSAEALTAFEAVLAKAPHWELALVGSASLAEKLGRPEDAVNYWRRAVVASPWLPDYRRRLVLLLVKKKAWDEARQECKAWVRLDPLSAEARTTHVLCLLAAGDKDEARVEFMRVEALAPENLRELQARFSKKLK